MTTFKSPCFSCRLFTQSSDGEHTCPAFPDGIPIEVLVGEPHTEVVPGQTGTFVFEQIDGGPSAAELRGYDDIPTR